MALKRKLNLEKHDGEETIRKQAPVGFSWTTAFFCPFVPLFRKDWKGFFTQLGIIVLFVILVSILPTQAIDFIPNGIVGIALAFFYNKMYIEALINDGFEVIDDDKEFYETTIKTNKLF